MSTKVKTTVLKTEETQGLDNAFLKAFDKLLWPNGVYFQADSQWIAPSCTGSSYAARNSLNSNTVDLISPWSKFIQKSVPRHILHFPETIELAEEVWVNAEEPSVVADKRIIYSLRALSEGYQLFFKKGTSEPIVKFVVTQDEPAYFINWKIKDEKLDEIANFIPQQQGLELAKVRFRENGPEEFILTRILCLSLLSFSKPRTFI